MIDHFRSDLFLMRKMKVTYILPIIFLLSSLLVGVVYLRINLNALMVADPTSAATLSSDVYVDEDGSFGEEYVNSLSEGFSAGFNAAMEEDQAAEEAEAEEVERPGFFSGGVYYESSVCEFFSVITSASTLLILAGLFAAFLFANDIRGGFRKNMIKINPNRWIAFTSKVATVLVYNILFLIYSFFVAFLCIALMGKSIHFGFDLDFFEMLALRLLTMFAFSMLIALITCFTKSTALGMVADLIFGLGVLDLVFYFFDLLIAFIGMKLSFELPSGFSLANYTLTGIASMLHPGMSSKLILRAVVVSVCFMAVSIFGAGYINQKRDIH
ncbi:MAG: hypothetical protein K6G47_09835 [Clostridia bacterium]|nr:hypothetical protein [Clostridia bacterium]